MQQNRQIERNTKRDRFEGEAFNVALSRKESEKTRQQARAKARNDKRAERSI